MDECSITFLQEHPNLAQANKPLEVVTLWWFVKLTGKAQGCPPIQMIWRQKILLPVATGV